MGKSGRNYQECGRRNDGRVGSKNPNPEKPGLISPNVEAEKFDDIMDIYADTDPGDQCNECYA